MILACIEGPDGWKAKLVEAENYIAFLQGQRNCALNWEKANGERAEAAEARVKELSDALALLRQ